MLLALTGIIASGVTFAFAATGASAPLENAIPASAPAIVDTGYSSAVAQAGTARVETCYLIEKTFETCVWEYNGLWVLDYCETPPSPICPRG